MSSKKVAEEKDVEARVRISGKDFSMVLQGSPDRKEEILAKIRAVLGDEPGLRIKAEEVVDFESMAWYQEIKAGWHKGKTVMVRRELLGLNQSQLSAKTGIRQSNIAAIESGSRGIGKDSAIPLASVLGCDWEDLLTSPPLRTEKKE